MLVLKDITQGKTCTTIQGECRNSTTIQACSTKIGMRQPLCWGKMICFNASKALHRSAMKTRLFLAAFIFFTSGYYTVQAPAATCDKATPRFTRQQLISTLRRDGFPNIMLDKVGHFDLKWLGNIRASEASCLSVIVYSAEFDNGPGTQTHAVARLLVIKNMHYIGMYPIDTLPLGISGNTVNFRGEEKWGNKIIFDGNDPPKQIHLEGEFRMFFK